MAQAIEKPPFYYDQIMNSPTNTVRILNKVNGTYKRILVGVYKDDFYMGIQNQWQTGGNSIIKMIVDTAASFITSRDVKMGIRMADTALDLIDKGNQGSSESDRKVQRFVAAGREITKDINSYANSYIYSADDYFKSFKGSNVIFPTNMSVTLISDERAFGDDPGNNVKDVYQDLKNILSVSIGESITDFSPILNKVGLEGKAAKALNGFFGIQKPPNGFDSVFANIGEDIPGTVSIVFGDPNNGGYQLNNMVISNVNFSCSKIRVERTKGDYRPLFIDVQVMFEPARQMNRNDILKVMGI